MYHFCAGYTDFGVVWFWGCMVLGLELLLLLRLDMRVLMGSQKVKERRAGVSRPRPQQRRVLAVNVEQQGC